MNGGLADARSRFESAQVFPDADLARIAAGVARGDEQGAGRLRARSSGEPVLLAVEADCEEGAVTGRDIDGSGPVIVGLECPECGEDAVEQAPDSLVPYEAQGLSVPRYVHVDGEPLCSVMGPRGYESAQPREVHADQDIDPLLSARSAVDTAVCTPLAEPAEHAGSDRGFHCELVDGSAVEAGDAGEVRS